MLIGLFKFGWRKKKKPLTILTYNTQIGVRGWELLERLLKEPVDLVCFQRFPEDWLGRLGEAHVFQPSYKGCGNGCVTLLRKSQFVTKGNTQEIDFGPRTSQSTAYVVSRLDDIEIVNTLPPYPDKEENVDEKPYKKHLNIIFARKTPSVIVGDMHFDQMEFEDVDFNGFRNHSSAVNFYDQEAHALNLTKVFINVPAHVEERVLAHERAAQRHVPVLFRIEY